jgi:uncharacterized membrane protein YgcG
MSFESFQLLAPHDQPQTVHLCMVLCGISDDAPEGGGLSTAQRIATDVFMNSYERAFNMTTQDLDQDIKTISKMVPPIVVAPAVRTKLQAFIEWVKQCFRCLQTPETYVFPTNQALFLTYEQADHEAFVTRSKTLATIAKPDKFRNNQSWPDFAAQFTNYLRQLPGRLGHPLVYVIRDEEDPEFDPDERITAQNRYIAAAALAGPAFESDSMEVHTYLLALIAGNTRAEGATQQFKSKLCGRTDWFALKALFEGVGAFKIEIVNAETTLDTMMYHGEKDGRLPWTTFESRLVKAFHDKNKNAREGTVVYDDIEKIKKLLKMIKPCSQLRDVAISVQRDLGKPNYGDMTFEAVLADMRNIIVTENKDVTGKGRNVGNTNSTRQQHKNAGNGGRGGRGGRGNGGRGQPFTHGGRGRGGRGGRGAHRYNKPRAHPDNYKLTLTNGKVIDAHPSYSFTDEEMSLMHPHDRQNIYNKRAEYRNQRANGNNNGQFGRSINQLTLSIPDGTDANTIASAITMQLSQANTQTPGGTPFGGRNEEANRRGNRNIAHFHSVRHVAPVRYEINASRSVPPQPGVAAANECDSNADTCCAGTNFVVMQYTSRFADVYPYDSSYQPIKDVPIVSAATAWTNPETDQTFILVFNETLYYGTSLPHTLWNPNQLRHNGVEVNDNPYDTSETRMSIRVEDVVIPLHTFGTKGQFITRAPTEYELQHCRQLHMTNFNEWNPKQVTLGAVDLTSIEPAATPEPFIHPFTSDSLLHNVDPALVQLRELATSRVRISSAYHELATRPEGTDTGIEGTGTLSNRLGPAPEPILGFEDVPARRTFISSERHLAITAENLSDQWSIGLEQARATLRATRQRGTRSAIMPAGRRYRADRQYNLRRLQGRFATDTMYGDIKSIDGKKYAQAYTHKNGFSAVYPIESLTGDAVGETLRNFANEHGAPDHLTYDGAANQTGPKTEFQRRIRKYDIITHTSEKDRPNQNPAEGGIRQLKMKWYRAMHRRNVPNRLWSFGLKWVSEIGNRTTNSSRYSNGRTPLECVTGITPDITEYVDFGFYVTNSGSAQIAHPKRIFKTVSETERKLVFKRQDAIE